MNEEKNHNPAAGHNPSEAEQIQVPLADLIRIRRQKTAELVARGVDPYPYKYDWTNHIADLLANFETLEQEHTVVRITGRIMLNRKMGKVFFADLRDTTDRIQIYVKRDEVGQENFDIFDLLDIGDIIGCQGNVFVTRTGERTVKVSSFQLLSKSLHPLPDKHSGLTDIETRYRRRYADLIVNPDVRATFVQRSKIIQILRDYLNNKGFLEVETPILQPLYGGASARPFKTHHNTLDIPMYMRIADELYLKRLIVGGYRKGLGVLQGFPQRRDGPQAQSGILDDRAVLGVCRLSRHGGILRRDAPAHGVRIVW